MNKKILLQIAVFFITFSLVLFLMSCEKSNDDIKVQYVVKGLNKKFRVAYMNEVGKTVYIDSVVNKNWSYSFVAHKGDLLYLFLRYQENLSYMDKFQFRIIVDGKIYKDAYSYDIDRTVVKNDSLRYEILRSGVVPLN